MRWFHLVVVGLFALATVIFAVQNLEIVNMTFLGFNARVPLAALVALIYVLGMATGGSLWAMLRRSIQGARRAPTP
jgi:uncharacterized integral membrane protein